MRCVPLIVAVLFSCAVVFAGAMSVRPISRWLHSWKLSPRTNWFELWKIWRSWVVLGCFLASLLSILFSGAFDIEELSSGAGAHILKPLVAQNLLVASVVMGMHGIYLGLMLYHLIFRYPVNDQKWFGGIAFFLIAVGYIVHALHDYLHELKGHETLNPTRILFSTPLFFALAYALMAGHSWYHFRKHEQAKTVTHDGVAGRPSDPIVPEGSVEIAAPERHAQVSREKWMRITDTIMVLLMVWVFGLEMRKGGGMGAISLPESESRREHPESIWQHPAAVRAYERLGAKDGVILLAMLFYGGARIVGKRKGKAKRPKLLERLLAHHEVDSKATDLSRLKSYLDGRFAHKSVWMDLKCGFGTQLRELIENLRLEPETLASMRILLPLDDDAQANERAMVELSKYRPESRPSVSGMYSDAMALMLQESDIIHIANAAYTPSTARGVLHLLSKARPGTLLLLRFTSGASYYRAISASMSCVPIRPYIHHATHELLLADLDASNEWFEPELVRPMIIMRYLSGIHKAATLLHITNWVESQYGEFSGDVIGRYLLAFKKAGVKRLFNSDWLYVREKADDRRSAGQSGSQRPSPNSGAL